MSQGKQLTALSDILMDAQLLVWNRELTLVHTFQTCLAATI